MCLHHPHFFSPLCFLFLHLTTSLSYFQLPSPASKEWKNIFSTGILFSFFPTSLPHFSFFFSSFTNYLAGYRGYSLFGVSPLFLNTTFGASFFPPLCFSSPPFPPHLLFLFSDLTSRIEQIFLIGSLTPPPFLLLSPPPPPPFPHAPP